MAEDIHANTNGTKTVALNVRLKSAEHVNLPIVSNYTDVHVAQGIAYVNFGFLEPAMLTEVGKHARKGEAVPKYIEGSLTTRVAIPLDSLLRLQQQLTQVLANLQQGLASKQS